jgi:hypothetical protein
MAQRRRIEEIFSAGIAGAALLGALSFACNSLSGIGDFAVGGEGGSTAFPDGQTTTGEGSADAPDDSSPEQDATTSEGSTSDRATPPDSPHDASEAAVEGGDGAGPVSDGGDGGAGGDGAQPDAGDAGPDTGGGTGPCDGGTPLVVHSNGLVGGTFTDCAPLGTYDLAQATEACLAYTGDAGACSVDPMACAQGDQVCGTVGSMCACWRYNGNQAGRYTNATICSCIGSSSPTWN